MKKQTVVGDVGETALTALYEKAERQLQDATNRLIPLEGRKVMRSEPWVQAIVLTAAQLADVLRRSESAPLRELERELMLLLAYNVEGDARQLVNQKRVSR